MSGIIIIMITIIIIIMITIMIVIIINTTLALSIIIITTRATLESIIPHHKKLTRHVLKSRLHQLMKLNLKTNVIIISITFFNHHHYLSSFITIINT